MIPHSQNYCIATYNEEASYLDTRYQDKCNSHASTKQGCKSTSVDILKCAVCTALMNPGVSSVI